MSAPKITNPPMTQLLALLEQVEYVLGSTAPANPQQVNLWEDLRKRAKDARAAVKSSAGATDAGKS